MAAPHFVPRPPYLSSSTSYTMEVIAPWISFDKSSHALGADSLLLSYYQLTLALIDGSRSNGRPSLPTELVLQILFFAQLISPRPSQSLSTHYTCARPVPPPLHHGLFRLARLPLCKAPLVRTPQLYLSRKVEIERIEISVKYVGNARLVTTTQWSDFYLRIMRANQDEPCDRPDKSELIWPCFESTSLVSCPEGGRRVVNPCDDLWRYLLPGDRLEVAVQTYAGEPQVDKFDAVVKVFERWQPELGTLRRL
ncbi:unnamed protein product [Rhizoctonia solani]|uniref:Uncharacterized protein n=1 Tax=Rhizoctonia solani TaxID=456999 RepID=A0A8H3HY58_9AGAM|nr:unnamed protein product [Rhizoctonia solani]